MAMVYQPEVDSSPKLDQDFITTFQELIGILWWLVKIRGVCILTKIYMLSSYQASPRKGRLEQIYHGFVFLKNNPKLTQYFDPREPLIYPFWFHSDSVGSFMDQYRDAAEQLPPSQMFSYTRCVPVSTTAYVNASHAYNKVTRRGHTGFIVFLNR